MTAACAEPPHPNPLPKGEGALDAVPLSDVTVSGPHPNPLPKGEGAGRLTTVRLSRSTKGEGAGGQRTEYNRRRRQLSGALLGDDVHCLTRLDERGNGWAHLDSNQGPTGYEPVALTN